MDDRSMVANSRFDHQSDQAQTDLSGFEYIYIIPVHFASPTVAGYRNYV